MPSNYITVYEINREECTFICNFISHKLNMIHEATTDSITSKLTGGTEDLPVGSRGPASTQMPYDRGRPLA